MSSVPSLSSMTMFPMAEALQSPHSKETISEKAYELTPLFFGLITKMTTPNKLALPHILFVHSFFHDATAVFNKVVLSSTTPSLDVVKEIDCLRERVSDYLDKTHTPYPSKKEQRSLEDSMEKIKLMARICNWVALTMISHFDFVSNKDSCIPPNYKAFHITKQGGIFLEDYFQNGTEPTLVKQLIESITTLKLTTAPSLTVAKRVTLPCKGVNEAFFSALCEAPSILPFYVVSDYEKMPDGKDSLTIYSSYCEHGDALKPPIHLGFELSIIKLITSLIYALSHMHSKGVVHNDVKPENIFYIKGFWKDAKYLPCCYAVLADLGLATMKGVTAMMGTAIFWPPECVLSDHVIPADPSKDIWALGVTLFEILNGTQGILDFNLSQLGDCKSEFLAKKAFYKEHIPDQAALDAHLYKVTERATKTRNLPRFPFLENLARMCLKYDPNERPTSKKLYGIIEEKRMSFYRTESV